MNCIRNIAARPREAGFSFVELMVVIVNIVIVATLALMQRGTANEQFQRQNVARELKVALDCARFDSVKPRATDANTFAVVTVASNSFTLITDVNGNGITTDAGDSIIAQLPPGIMITDMDLTPASLSATFDMRGEVNTGEIRLRVSDAVTSNILVVTP